MRIPLASYLGVLIVLAGVSGPVPVAAQESLRIAAIVNDEIISAYDLESRIRLIIVSSNLPESPEVMERLRPQALRSLIDDRLRLQETKKAGITVADEELVRAMADIERANGMPADSLGRFLASRGVDKSALANQIEADVAWSKFLKARVMPRVQVSDDEIDAGVKKLEEAKNKPQYLVAEIFLPIDSPADEEEANTLANRMIGELRQGASFPALARNFSKGPTAAKGGNLGWILEGQLPADLDAAVRRLEPGQMSGAVRSLDGIRILHLRERRVGGARHDEPEPAQPEPPPPPPPAATAAGPVRNASLQLSQLVLPLKEKASQADITATGEKLRAMAATAKNCKEFDALAKKTSPLSGPIGTVDLSDLPQDLRTVLANLKQNQISPPRRTADGLSVVMVCSRRDKDEIVKGSGGQTAQRAPAAPVGAAKAPPSKAKPKDEDPRAEVRANLIAEKMAVQARRYMRDLRRSAVVDMR